MRRPLHARACYSMFQAHICSLPRHEAGTGAKTQPEVVTTGATIIHLILGGRQTHTKFFKFSRPELNTMERTSGKCHTNEVLGIQQLRRRGVNAAFRLSLHLSSGAAKAAHAHGAHGRAAHGYVAWDAALPDGLRRGCAARLQEQRP